jgi:uncharacterized protein (DUF2235 family)
MSAIESAATEPRAYGGSSERPGGGDAYAPHAKNIVICSDGTGNSAVKDRGTNVFKLFEAVDSHGHRRNPSWAPQVTYYDDGVGTENFKYLRAFAGATGFGLSRNVKQLYLQLSRVYEPGDRIYLFGFSRGAFTVRTLAGMIVSCGILNTRHADFPTEAALRKGIERVYSEYRKRCRTKLAALLRPDRDPGPSYSKRHCVKDPEFAPDGRVRIRFVGVWDTVDAVGLPLRIADVWNDWVWRFKFPDRKLSPLVDKACHALAVDDERESFTPVLWDETEEPDGRIEQVWFAGAHSNVGGGYPRQGMSLVALDWMMNRAEEANLRFVKSERTYFDEHRNVDDKLYDPRAGAGTFYRWRPRDIERLCARNGAVVKVHASVFERIARATEGYAPGNIPSMATVVTTSRTSPIDRTAIERVLQTGETQPVHRAMKRALRLGRASYDVFLGTIAAALVLILRATYENDGGWQALLRLSIMDMGVLARIPSNVISSPLIMGILGVGLGLASMLGRITDRKVDQACSDFWHVKQPELLGPLMLKTGDGHGGERRDVGPH